MKKKLNLSLMGILLVTSITSITAQANQLPTSIEIEKTSLHEEGLKDDFFQTYFLTSDVLKEEANDRFYKENFLVSDEAKESHNEKNFAELFLN